MNKLERLERTVASTLQEVAPVRIGGRINQVAPNFYRVVGLSSFVCLGDTVVLETKDKPQHGEIIRLDEEEAIVKPFDRQTAVGIGTRIYRVGGLTIHPDASWKGRVVNALGQPVDDRGPIPPGTRAVPLDRDPPPPLKRARVTTPVRTGVRVVDLFTPLCIGQRVGIFAGSGVGKSTLLAMFARSGDFDTVVVGLVGERSREVREFIEDALGEAIGKSVVVVSTGDESPMMRRLAPKTAMTIAEHFRDRGDSVLLIIDSATRFAHASRDVAMAAGEPPVARGYTPSVFSELPRLLERAGPGVNGGGAITGVFSVLVDGDDHNDPVADSIRGILDGHIVLSRSIADAGRYPAVDVLASISRLAQHAWTADQRELVMRLKGLIARYEDTRDLRLMGGYQPGNDPQLDYACQIVPRIYEALRQGGRDKIASDPFDALARALSADASPAES
ncbi:flagellum-specific ATP synthase [Breoghania corrubedonensis]|uniref:Flagellum-specific ATP synthase n=1 Tax=Breoghania corrubedonensis TaxID=665038 RepID=A0A2T5V8U6_9HYPH|nr:flagellar protein export ATPase FliI [Breoghania corrubedonensis]PTW60185.1 flagellum-specific ATP synthase [Breoghania corrubedonensis]